MPPFMPLDRSVIYVINCDELHSIKSLPELPVQHRDIAGNGVFSISINIDDLIDSPSLGLVVATLVLV